MSEVNPNQWIDDSGGRFISGRQCAERESSTPDDNAIEYIGALVSVCRYVSIANLIRGQPTEEEKIRHEHLASHSWVLDGACGGVE